MDIASARHTHLCPRQVLGARIGLAGASALGLDLPRADKRLLVILETDGCFADGIDAATGCTVGHRTMRIEDYGKIAATFVDVETERALRIAPSLMCANEPLPTLTANPAITSCSCRRTSPCLMTNC